MKFYSTSGKSEPVSFIKAAENGLAPDGGLYMPESIPEIPDSFWQRENPPSIREIGSTIASKFLGDQFSDDELQSLINDAINFEAPLVQLRDDLFILELFHGPTLAFKDFGARFMARLFSKTTFEDKRELVILVATSGDTGGAVANGFYDLPGVKVCLLFPEGKVSTIQQKQMTTLGKNITALEVKGTFDDCQKLVKQAFSDTGLNQKLRLSSANSINIARLIPQSFYYADAWFQLKKVSEKDPVFSVPSGNFGNLTAGLMLQKMGMPVAKFLASTNRNDTVPNYLQGDGFLPKPSVQTISNAMDVGNPSNFDRIKFLFDQDDSLIRKNIWGASFSDDETRSTIKKIYNETGYVLDPHTAVGVLAAEKYKVETGLDHPSIVLATA
ncbi:MAG: threonine synthase, partial [Balneolaceae bacterium]